MRGPARLVLAALLLIVAGCAARSTPSSDPPLPAARARPLEVREGFATYYGRDFHGKRTASGERFDMNRMVAAHPRYPFGTIVRVTHLANGRSVQVRIQDRGPAAA